MSVRVMTAVFDYSESRGNDRLILLVIADRSNDDGTGCWRGKETIAHMARTSRATVTRAIARLEEIGELVADRRPGITSQYRIVLPGVGSNCADPQSGGSAHGVAEGSAHGVADGRLNGEPRLIPESSIEPSKDLAPLARQRDPHWDALVSCWSLDERELAPAERGRLNQACKILRDLDADPAEIPARRAMYALLFRDAAQTPLALCNRWAECRPDPARLPPQAGRAMNSIGRAAARALAGGEP